MRRPTTSWGRARVLTMTSIVLLSTLSPVPAHADPGSQVAPELLQLTQSSRRAHGVGPLESHADLRDVARSWSREMAESGSLRHNPEKREKVCCWEVLSENVGMRSVSSSESPRQMAERIHDLFMGSSGHRANILDARVGEVGVGVTVRDGEMWVSVLFRKRRGAAPNPSPPPSAPTSSEADRTTTPEPPDSRPSVPTSTAPEPTPPEPPLVEPIHIDRGPAARDALAALPAGSDPDTMIASTVYVRARKVFPLIGAALDGSGLLPGSDVPVPAEALVVMTAKVLDALVSPPAPGGDPPRRLGFIS